MQYVQPVAIDARESTRKTARSVAAGLMHDRPHAVNHDCRHIDRLTSTIISNAISVHRALGPGLLESAYLACLCYELSASAIRIEAQKPIRLVYRDVKIDCAYRADLIVDGAVVVEVKALEALAPIHSRQLYTYLRLADCPVGLILNFGAATMKTGIKRVVNGFPAE